MTRRRGARHRRTSRSAPRGYDFYGGNRKGDNLFGNSLVALDARTGKRLWHFQLDPSRSVGLRPAAGAEAADDPARRPRTSTSSRRRRKHGFVFVFDRVTGEPIWPIEERPVPQSDVPGEQTSPTQPFPTAPPPFARQSFTEKDINPYPAAGRQDEAARAAQDRRATKACSRRRACRARSDAGPQRRRELGQLAVDPQRRAVRRSRKKLPSLHQTEPRPRVSAGTGRSRRRRWREQSRRPAIVRLRSRRRDAGEGSVP